MICDFGGVNARRGAVCAVFMSLAFSLPTKAQPVDVTAAMKANAIPSISYARISGGRIVETGAFGEQSPGVPAKTSTLYNLASLTKPLTAEIILRLASKGVLNLDEPMAPIFVDPDIKSDPRSLLLTPRMALTHQAGFANWRDKTGLKFIFNPGTAYGYSGEGYQYVARFAERKTGESFEELADSYLLNPTNLKNTSYIGQSWFDGRVAVPTNAKGESTKPNITPHYIAADLAYTTANDYALFLLSVLHDEGLSRNLAMDRMHVQRSLRDIVCVGQKASTCPDDIGPGLGFEVLVFPGHTILMHTGKDPGLFTFAYLDKTTGDGAVILTNGDAGAKAALPLLKHFHPNTAFIRYLSALSQN